MRTTITPELGAERARLMTDLQESYARAMNAIQRRDNNTWLAEEMKQSGIVRRIKEIDGTTGQPWNA